MQCLKTKEHLERENVQIKILKMDSYLPGASLFSIATINLLSLKRIRASDFKNNFVIVKREIETHLKMFLVKLFLARYPCTMFKL